MGDAPDADGRHLDDLVETITERTIQNGLGDLIMGQLGGLAGVFGGAGSPGQGGAINQLHTLALNSRGWLISNQRVLLADMYSEHGLVETIVDVPVNDALRSGYEITSGQLSPDEIAELHADCEEDGTNQTCGQAMKWTRLYGGGGLLISTDQPPETPLDQGAITGDRPMELIPFDMWELYPEGRKADPTLGNALDGKVRKLPYNAEFFDYYGKRVHRSRIVPMRGKEPPSFLRGRVQGWGLSVCETLIRSINQYLKSNSLAFEVLDEFKLDVYKIRGFTQAMGTRDGTRKILERTTLSNMQKNYLNALVIDKEDDHQGKQLNFTGLSDVMKEIRMQLASELRMPMTKLFGISASGFNSGEDDIEVYNGMVESEVRGPMRALIVRVVQLKCLQKFGFVPDDVRIKYRPLRILSAKDEEEVKDRKFARITTAVDKGLMSAKEAKDAMNQEGLMGVEVDPDEDLRDAALRDADQAGEGERDEEAEGGEEPPREEEG